MTMMMMMNAALKPQSLIRASKFNAVRSIVTTTKGTDKSPTVQPSYSYETMDTKNPSFYSETKPAFFRKVWFSDRAVYPLIAILGFTGVYLVITGAHALTSYKDVQIDRTKRGKIMRDWGDDEHEGIVKTMLKSRYQKMLDERSKRRSSPEATVAAEAAAEESEENYNQ